MRLRSTAFYCLLPTAYCLLVLLAAVADACPGCKEALFDPGQLQQKLSTAQGYALSIGLMLMVPLVLIVGISLLIVRAHRRAKL